MQPPATDDAGTHSHTVTAVIATALYKPHGMQRTRTHLAPWDFADDADDLLGSSPLLFEANKPYQSTNQTMSNN